jgi:phosphoserine phosphatase
MIIASDLEGTLTTGYSWKGYGNYLRAHGRGLAYHAYYARTLPAGLLARTGITDLRAYQHRWLDGLLGLFKGQTSEAFKAITQWVVEQEMWSKRRVDVIAILEQHVRDGHRVILTSGGYTPVVEAFAARMGISEFIATPIVEVEGYLTGQVSGSYNTGTQKAENLRAYLDGSALDVAYGDTLPDVPMLELCRSPVAVYPEPQLARVARDRGWRIMSGE